jgi:hypothetical protein
MISNEASQISELFAQFRKAQCLVYNFNTSHSQRSGTSKLCDHIVITPRGVHFIEVKLKSTRDRMSDGQEQLESLLERIQSNKGNSCSVNYWNVDSYEYAQVVSGFIVDEISL